MVLFAPYFCFFSARTPGYAPQREYHLAQKPLVMNYRNLTQTASKSSACEKNGSLLLIQQGQGCVDRRTE